LLHLVDATQEDVVSAYETVRGELAAYGADLEDKAEIVALSKADAVLPEDVEDRRKALELACGQQCLLLSAVSKNGVDEALYALTHSIESAKVVEARENAPAVPWSP
ncbi:MAG: GTPase ObgE, partial [Pseudomonadota bacterium]